jgi:hypothetical protein
LKHNQSVDLSMWGQLHTTYNTTTTNTYVQLIPYIKIEA